MRMAYVYGTVFLHCSQRWTQPIPWRTMTWQKLNASPSPWFYILLLNSLCRCNGLSRRERMAKATSQRGHMNEPRGKMAKSTFLSIHRIHKSACEEQNEINGLLARRHVVFFLSSNLNMALLRCIFTLRHSVFSRFILLPHSLRAPSKQWTNCRERARAREKKCKF